MGIAPNVSHDQWPKQGPHLGKIAEVTFDYDFDRTVLGTILRDDAEPPYCTIIYLADGRYVLAGECQYHVVETSAFHPSVLGQPAQEQQPNAHHP